MTTHRLRTALLVSETRGSRKSTKLAPFDGEIEKFSTGKRNVIHFVSLAGSVAVLRVQGNHCEFMRHFHLRHQLASLLDITLGLLLCEQTRYAGTRCVVRDV